MRSFAVPVLVSCLAALTTAQQNNDVGDLTNIDPSALASISGLANSLTSDRALTSNPAALASSIANDFSVQIPSGALASVSGILKSYSAQISDLITETNPAAAASKASSIQNAIANGATTTGGGSGGSSDSQETSGPMSGGDSSQGGQSGDNGNAGARPSAALGLCGAAVMGVFGAAVLL